MLRKPNAHGGCASPGIAINVVPGDEIVQLGGAPRYVPHSIRGWFDPTYPQAAEHRGRIKAFSGLEGVALHLVGPGEGSTISALGSTYTTKTDGEATGGAYSLVEEELWGDPTPLHLHSREEEAFYVLSGRLAVWVGGTEQVAEPGAFLLIPRGVPHAARRVTDEPVRMLTLVSPSGLQRFFESVVREGEEELLAHPDRLAALAAEFGSEILGDYPSL